MESGRSLAEPAKRYPKNGGGPGHASAAPCTSEKFSQFDRGQNIARIFEEAEPSKPRP
jgi:hypothetical protein